jgi:hypothetical protein
MNGSAAGFTGRIGKDADGRIGRDGDRWTPGPTARPRRRGYGWRCSAMPWAPCGHEAWTPEEQQRRDDETLAALSEADVLDVMQQAPRLFHGLLEAT